MNRLRWLALALCLAPAACSTVVAGSPHAAERGGTAPGGPIQPAQLQDLLTPSDSLAVVPGSPLFETNMQAAIFIAADPADCHGVVGFGRFPLFPTDYTGREARTQVDNSADQHQLLEASATYPSDFDAAGFLKSVRDTVTRCQHPVSAWGDAGRKYTVDPTPLTASAPEIAHWSTNLAGEQWICEFSVIAKANVVAEVVTCSPDRSIDNQALAAQRLAKIDELLHSTA
ncbi:sensor domain-containing protein [Mycobacterium talmoniae]|uniref:sensor domain-containing protein n=1 Tax=Mycobacterium talmoniae TaxID=1858794 RepID=UPI0009F69018